MAMPSVNAGSFCHQMWSCARAGSTSRAQGLCGHRRGISTEADATHPATEVVGDDVEGHPDGIGAKAPGRQVVHPDAVLQISDHVLDHGVAAVIGLEVDRLAFTVGDKRVVVVSCEQRQLAAREASPVAR